MSEFFRRPDNPPTAEQVMSFARMCVLFAHRHGQLARYKNWYKIGPMARYTPPDVVAGEPFGFLYEDTFKVYAKIDTAREMTQANVLHSIVAREINGVDEGVHATELCTVDKFRVLDGNVVESSRSLEQTVDGMKQSQHGLLLDEISLENLYIPNDLAERISIEDEFRVVTEADFAGTAREVAERMNMVDSEEHEYNEKRKNYLTYFDR